VTALLLLALAADPAPIAVNSLKATPPAEWVVEKPSNRLRSAQFKLKSGSENLADGEVNVMPESNPKTDVLFPRWKATYIPPDGKTIDEIAKETTFDVGNSKITLLDVSGTWKYRERPQDPKSKEEMKPEYRTIWAVVAEKDACTHLRLSGPQVVVAKHYDSFVAMLKGMK
jgi:hypothetical protein